MLYSKNQKKVKSVKKTTKQGQGKKSRPKGNSKLTRGQGK